MKRVFLTALTSERYIPGVMALIRSLKKVKTKFNLVIMIPESKSAILKEKLQTYGVLNFEKVCIVVKEDVKINGENIADKVIEEKYAYWKESYFKLQAANCTQFEKIILIDSDIMVVKNIDHLFEKPSMSAAINGKCVHPEWNSLNSGLVVIEPSKKLYAELISNIIPAITYRESIGLQAGDQDVFHMTFPKWRENKELLLSEKYNVSWGWIDALCKKEHCEPKDICVIHFVGKQKPWDFRQLYFFRLFLALLKNGKVDKIFYKVWVWNEYWKSSQMSKKETNDG